MATLEHLPAELIAEIALMCRHPGAILRLMMTSKPLYVAIGGQYKCKEVLVHAMMFKNVINEIKQCILYKLSSYSITSQIHFAKDISKISSWSIGVISSDVLRLFVYTDTRFNGANSLTSYRHTKIGKKITSDTIINDKFDGKNHNTEVTFIVYK
jgi:hypothetical protein